MAATKTATKRSARAASSPRSSRRTAEQSTPLADVGVPSPYALAESIVGHRIEWDSIVDRRSLLEQIFQTDYTDLFSPSNGSPLYIGQDRKDDSSVVRRRPALRRDAPMTDFDGIHTLADLIGRFDRVKAADIPVRSVEPGSSDVVVRLGETTAQRDARWSRIFDDRLIDILFPQLLGYHPDGLSWTDGGRFYNEGTEFLDPVQGQVGDCYFVAALSSVAWSMPFTIVDRNRATAIDNEAFRHQIGFTGNSGVETVEVSDQILLTGWGGAQFARSSEAGEIWPAVYEKAYAKWRLGEPTDYPAIPNIAGGDPSIACRQLTGLNDYRNWHGSYTAAQILDLVKAHTSNGRTTTPMISWTYGDDGGNPDDASDIAYRDANVVAGHAYSVLGWVQRREYVLGVADLVGWHDVAIVDPAIPQFPIPVPDPGPFVGGSIPVTSANRAALQRYVSWPLRSRLVDYVVLRNPWGYCEASGSSVATGSDRAYDISWWRDIPLGTNGVFAMELDAYHRYFAGTGGAH